MISEDKKTTMAWYNYKTQDYEYLHDLPEDRVLDFLPQNPAVQGLYRCYVGMGKPMYEAMELVLLACVGK